MPVFERLSLRVDGANVVADVTDAWNPLVGSHRLAALTATAPGEPLHRAVDNGDAYTLYETMLERARARFRVAIDVRAVSSAHATRYELSFAPRGFAGDVEISLRLLHDQRSWTMPLFDPEAPRRHESVRVCDFCQRVLGFSWVEPDIALRHLELDGTSLQPRVRAAVCDDCERIVYHAAGASRLGLAS
jgi:hypothetical protein